jgi:hypothetical protein
MSLCLPSSRIGQRLRRLSDLSYSSVASRCLACMEVPAARSRIHAQRSWRQFMAELHMRHNRTEQARVAALQQEVSRAEADYQRFRAAYLQVARDEPGHEVALAMIGTDMDRAHARLQALIGLPRLPFTHEPSTIVRREAQRLTEENS